MLAGLALLLIIIAAFLFWQSGQVRKKRGLPGGRLIYSDTSRWQKQEEPLYDSLLGLTGRPDYLIEDGEILIPVEVKSSRPPHAPYDAHIFQLAAYCLLVQRTHGIRPPFGVLHYAHSSQATRTFAVEYTSELEEKLTLLLAEMRTQEKRREVYRSHQSKSRCKACGFRSICDQRLE